jgi:hypothetical protein
VFRVICKYENPANRNAFGDSYSHAPRERVIYVMVQSRLVLWPVHSHVFQSALIRDLVRMETAAAGLITEDIANPSSPRNPSGWAPSIWFGNVCVLVERFMCCRFVLPAENMTLQNLE